MYKHILVPIDDSLLSVETVRQAVEFARSIGAKVTFFHACEDYGASSLAALERVMSPAAFNDSMAGDGRALLAKAEAVARAMGVSHASSLMTSDRAYDAILTTAEARGCDLIFMASHGKRGIRGLVLGSQTQRVLQHATVPVMVAAVESNLTKGEFIAPLAVIRDEHRSLAAVIHGMEFLVRQARLTGRPPSFPLVRAMIHYVREFPDRQHHPKEEAYLFAKLRARTNECDATLVELERQHGEGHDLIAELERTAAAYEADPSEGLTSFAAAVERFGTTQIRHMALESKVILPAARKHLTAADWAEIGAAFAGNSDPRFSIDSDEEFRQLFARIINLAPEAVVGTASRTPTTTHGA